MNLRIIEIDEELKLLSIRQCDLICELEVLKIKTKELEDTKNERKNFLKMKL